MPVIAAVALLVGCAPNVLPLDVAPAGRKRTVTPTPRTTPTCPTCSCGSATPSSPTPAETLPPPCRLPCPSGSQCTWAVGTDGACQECLNYQTQQIVACAR